VLSSGGSGVLRLDKLHQGEHVLLAGMTGSGKTTLAQRMLSSCEHVIVIDTKHELKWPGFGVTSDIDSAFTIDKKYGGYTIFRPRTVYQIEKVYARAYAEWGWTVYCDEVYQIGVSSLGKRTNYPPAYSRCLTAGRTRGVTVWTGTQRPKYFPIFAVTESVHFFIFELGSADDRKDLYRMVGVDALAEDRQAGLGSHEFLYFSRLNKAAVRSKLNFPRPPLTR
jgi:energy-coupling factor transporter ATP-binding protein EcfA2